MKSLLILFSFFSTFSLHLKAQDSTVQETTRILFIFDASQSMFGQFSGSPKIDVAQKLFSEALDSLKSVENLELALRVYGNRSRINSAAQDCNDTHLEVPFGSNNIDQIKHVIKGVVPKGTTPIARSLELSEFDFPPCTNCRNVIVLITDGIEACDGDPCAIAKALRKNDVFLKPFVIGVGVVEDYKEHFYCIGNYFDAKDKDQFKTVLGLVLAEALNNTTCQVNLLDVEGAPTETNVNMSFYDQFSGELKYNYLHTMNHAGLPDTLTLDPSVSYKIVVHTIPSVVKENVRLKPSQHNVIEIETPQGTIDVNVLGSNKTINYKCQVRPLDGCSTLFHQESNNEIKYIVGTYEVEVYSLPRIKRTIEVAQSELAEIEVPQSGILLLNVLSSGYGAIYEKRDKELELIYRLKEKEPSETIQLLPGDYTVIYRSKNANRSFQTVEKEFTIKSGKSVRISL